MHKSAEQVNSDLKRLIEEAKLVNPNLVKRLQYIQSWVSKKKPGLIKSKKHLMQFLEELITFTDNWLKIQYLPAEDRELVFATLPQCERYWYEHLFPEWINERDPKIEIWKQKLLDGSFAGSDAPRISGIRQQIEKRGGDSFSPYIADLSMATDIIAVGSRGKPLCVQITTLRRELTDNKQDKWLKTLKHWKIEKGLFMNFIPTLSNVNFKIAYCILEHSDLNQDSCYCLAIDTN
ncbi:MAG: hypothetical protein RMY64_36645 [Nostoc sp. DedQUE08]|uniref:hypothetical protein n=1 Tax=Nostoc sp. DedQUE08 TaxID=3075393 RepID=UPI002AD407D7|nr:hypothetical protein [Nostoc sp. DedQUE08]MDZ8071091.1 hypothetical protein [Nostoc sp. DedQUE08]